VNKHCKYHTNTKCENPLFDKEFADFSIGSG
jgi:hypothetical protein